MPDREDDNDDDGEDFSGAEFSVVERRKLRKLLTEDERTRWAWATARTWVLWIGGVAVAVTSAYTWLRDLVRALAKP